MAPRAKDTAWDHVKTVDGVVFRKNCNKHIRGVGIHRVKQHLVGIRGQVLPCEAPNEAIEGVRADLLNQFKKFEEDKARKKEIEVEIGRKRELANATMRRSKLNEFEGSSSAPSSVGKDPFHYVIPSHPNIGETQPKKIKTLQHYFSTPSLAFASATTSQSQVQSTQIRSTLDEH